MEENNNLEQNKKKPSYSRLYKAIAALLAAVLIFLMSAASFIGKDREYSSDENRYLQARPKLSLSAVTDGRYMEDMEDYLSDQFVARDALVRSRTVIDVMFGKKEINGVYLGKNRFLFEKPSPYNEDTVNETISAVNNFAVQHGDIKTYFALAPNASEILSKLMPANAPTENQTEQIQRFYSGLNANIQAVDICSELKSSDDPGSLYYRTDHHWTTDAAEIAFKRLSIDMGLDTSGVRYETYAVSDSFQGTMASSAGLFNAKDTIRIAVPSDDMSYVVTYSDQNRKSSSIFDSSKLSEKNKYEVFFGGNFGEIKIDTDADTDNVLMVVKDSYANCLIPMLLPYYKTIVIIDPRYFSGDIERTIRRETVTDMLWMYNVNTLLKDTSIAEMFKTAE